MRIPRYTDDRYPHGYRRAAETDVKATFNRIKREIAAKAEKDAANAAEVEVKVAKIKRTA